MDRKNVEDIYRLSELQEAMLVHRMQRGAGDTGLLQLRATLVGELDRGAFEDAWRATVERHPVLRSSVHWEELRHPVQVVSRRIDLGVHDEDWRDKSAAEVDNAFASFLSSDRDRGLDIERAPAFRVTLLRTSDHEHRLLWTCHHVLLDGWSSALVLAEVLERYRCLTNNEVFAHSPPPSFHDYLRWLPSRDSESIDLWGSRDTPTSTYLSGSAWSGQSSVDGRTAKKLDRGADEAVRAWARENYTTANGLILGCWTLLLHERTEAATPAFGFTVSGRSLPFPRIDSVVGMLANTLPFWAPVNPETSITDWFLTISETQQHLQEAEHLPLATALRAGGLTLQRPLFDSLVTFANYPGIEATASRSDSPGNAIALIDVAGDVTSAYPFTLAVKPGERLEIEAHYDTSRFAQTEVEDLLGRFVELLQSVVSGNATTLGELLLAPTSSGDAESEASAPSPAAEHDHQAAAPVATPTEAQLARIWSTLLRITDVGTTDNFFELGGHSLLVAEMIDRVQHDFGVDLAPGTVFSAPTIRELASRIQAEDGGAHWRSLVTIRSAGDQTPLFLVHGLGGEIDWAYNLAHYLPAEQPLYALQSPAEPMSELVAMASYYVTEIRTRQPDGPYRLGGYCIGGAIAYEMARQILQGGDRVELLLLIDSVPRGYAHGEPAPAAVRLTRGVRNFLSKPPDEMLATLRRRAHTTRLRLARRIGSGASRPLEIDEIMDMRRIPGVYHDAAFQHFRAIREYEPLESGSPSYSGDVHLFRSADSRFSPDLGWGELVNGSVHVEEIDGHHSDVLKEPHVRGLAERISKAIRSVKGGGPPSTQKKEPKLVAPD